jgi:hypothetical protein
MVRNLVYQHLSKAFPSAPGIWDTLKVIFTMYLNSRLCLSECFGRLKLEFFTGTISFVDQCLSSQRRGYCFILAEWLLRHKIQYV